MKTPSQYRAQAREALQNRWGEAAIVSLIILVVALVISAPSFAAEWAGSITTLLSVLVLPLQYAYYIALLERTRGSEEELTHYTLQYTINRAYASTRFLVAGLLIIVISMVAAIFTLGIGAIIVSYMYSMVPYLLHDYPELTPREAMKISREMMAGQKVEKVFNHEAYNFKKFCEMNERLRIESTNALTFSGMMVPTVVSLSYFNYA